MDVGQVMEQLNLPDGAWQNDWPASEATFPKDILFLKKEFLAEACAALQMKEDILAAFMETSAMFNYNPALRRFFWHCRHVLLDREKYGYPQFMALPTPAGDREMFYAFVFLSVLPAVRTFHQQHGIPEDIAIDSLSDLELWVRTYHEWYGRWGFGERNWLFHHFRGNIYKLGRLQFLIDCFEDDLHLLRGRNDPSVMLLAPDATPYRRDGQFDGTSGVWEDQPKRTRYQETNEAYTGTHITPDGRITNDPVHLKKSDWQEVLKKGDPALSFHIPAVGPMDTEACRQSFTRAMDFFPKHFPDKPFKAFFSHSWLYDHQLRFYLPPDSNIIRFQRECYLYPLQGTNDKQLFERVFNDRFTTIHQAPQNTSLQKAVVAHVKNGGHWRTSGALLLPETIRDSRR